MALFVAVKFSQDEMPKIYDPGKLQDLRPEEFVVVPRHDTEDVAFVSGLEYKSSQQLKLHRTPYPKVVRRAAEQEVEAWWDRKLHERRALVLGKEKAAELRMDIKISHVRIDPSQGKAVYHFTSDQRVDFRQLVKELGALLKLRIELWQIGVRDEARFVDGFGVCGLQTCCSSWLKEFRPITIRMAKEQDIHLPPTKLSGQCGRLLCCLSYEVDQYRQMSRGALPKGATIRHEEKDLVIVDRNLIAGTYLVSDGAGLKTIKAADLDPSSAKIPEQLKRFGKKVRQKSASPGQAEKPSSPAPSPQAAASPPSAEVTAAPEAPPEEPKPRRPGKKRRRPGRGARQQGAAPPPAGAPPETGKPQRAGEDFAPPKKESGKDGKPKGRRPKKRRRPS